MKTNISSKHQTILMVIIVLIIGIVIGWMYVQNRGNRYVREGYGGYSRVDDVNTGLKAPLDQAQSAYDRGDYKKAEADALKIVGKSKTSTDPKLKKDSAKARYILAFTSARRKDMKEARDRFAVLKTEASKLPDKGKQQNIPGQASPTLEEEGAYQHAVCTGALGDKAGAEKEYVQFMQDYPESPLVHGCIQRIARLHNAKYPPKAEAAWKQAMQVAKQRDDARQLKAAQCGPECLTELRKRNGIKADPQTLSKEMKTDKLGTSMKAMADAAAKRGVTLKGLKVTQKGLKQQNLPLIAFIVPGHYVIFESINEDSVQVWDSNGAGLSKPATKTIKTKDLKHMWDGIVLVKG